MGSWVSLATFVFGLVAFAVGVVVALSNREVRRERIEHLEGRVETLERELDEERRTCDRKVDELRQEVVNANAHVVTLTGQFVAKLTENIAEHVGRAVLTYVQERDRR